jgi:N-acetylmuramoyl-L-alanine amidase
MAQLEGLNVAIDVQHLWKPPPHQHDRGSVYSLPDGSHRAEADAAAIYAAACARWLRGRGAEVLENQPTHGVFVGSYPQRNRAALAWGAHCYLACHLNAGRGRYALFESMVLSAGHPLASDLGLSLLALVPETGSWKHKALRPADRGAICIESCGAMAALIVEPFFGDTPECQALLSGPNLVRVGEALAQGVSEWWTHRSQPVT